MTSNPGSVSAIAGMSGSSTNRSRDDTAKPRKVPPLICANATVPVSTITSRRPPKQVLHDLGVAAVGNAAHGGAGFDVDQLADQMVHAAGHVHAIGDRVGRGPGAGDEIAERFDRRIWRGRHHHGIAGDHGDEGEILERIVGQRLGDRRACRERAGQHSDRVSVGLRFRQVVPRRHPAHCRVLHHDRLAEPVGELVRQQPADEIRAAAGGRRGHDPQRTRWPWLGRERRCNGHADHRRKHRPKCHVEGCHVRFPAGADDCSP